MKTSVGSTVSMNIVFTFIVIIFAFVMAALSYYKAYKVNNVIADSIEKYEGYNSFAEEEINKNLFSLGYNQSTINCGKHKVNGYYEESVDALEPSGNGYCVYYNVVTCIKENNVDVMEKDQNGNDTGYCKSEYYNYIVQTYINFNIPIVNQLVKFPVYTKTNSIYGCYGDNC